MTGISPGPRRRFGIIHPIGFLRLILRARRCLPPCRSSSESNSNRRIVWAPSSSSITWSGRRQTKGPSGNNCAILAADASRLAALLVAYIVPLCSLLAPCQPGASTPGITHLFPDGPLDSREILPHLMLPVRPVVAAERSPVVQVVPNPAALEHVRETVRFLAALPGT